MDVGYLVMFRVGPRIEFGEEGKGAVISSLVAILIGLGLVVLGFNTYTNQNQALENPVNVSATVVDTGITEDSSRRGGIDYQPEIEYEYTFEGQTYTSDSMHPGGQLPDEHNIESEAREVIDRYSQGSEITVFVPPENPGDAFIEAEKTSDPLFFMGIGVLFMVLGGYNFLKTSYT